MDAERPRPSFFLNVPAGEVVDFPRRRHGFSPLIEPASYVERLDLEKIFGRPAPLQVDLGCGDGSFLCALAERLPQKNFLGIERLLGRSNSAARKAGPSRTGGKLDNVRVLRMESSYAVRYLLPPASVETFYLLFPDPWPKRRHQRRRVVNEEFLKAISDALAVDGTFRIATDQLDYFEHMQELARTMASFAVVDPSLATNVGVNASPARTVDPAAAAALAEEALPPTKFEKAFQERGAAIYRLVLRKVSPVR